MLIEKFKLYYLITHENASFDFLWESLSRYEEESAFGLSLTAVESMIDGSWIEILYSIGILSGLFLKTLLIFSLSRSHIVSSFLRFQRFQETVFHTLNQVLCFFWILAILDEPRLTWKIEKPFLAYRKMIFWKYKTHHCYPIDDVSTQYDLWWFSIFYI